jgi:dolichol-phosphate mannosyltransferase
MTIKIALLIPTYNEAVSIVELLDKLTEFRANKSSNFDVIVIDDNSPDGTANIVDNLTSTLGIDTSQAR